MAGIGLALGLASLGVTVATTAASFGQAAAERKKQLRAEKAAEKALEDARKRLDVNYMEDLGINKEIYDIARDRSMVQAAGLMEAAREGRTRGVASTAGQVYQQDLLGQQQIMAQQEQEMNRIEELIAQEDARLAGLQADISLREAEGAQRAAAEAENAKRAAVRQGIEGATSAVGQAVSMAPLYSKGTAAQRKKAMGTVIASDVGVPLGNIENATRRDFLKFERNLDPSVLNKIRSTDEYADKLQSLKFGQNFSSSPYIFNMGGVNAGLDTEAYKEYLRYKQLESMFGGK